MTMDWPHDQSASGPLAGLRVVEIAGIGPGPHACMILADLGADVVRIERHAPNPLGGGELDFLTRGRPSVALDLKHPDAVAAVLEMVAGADVLVEGMRPGAMERLGLGPDTCRELNPRLIYGRMTGWGQTGPLAMRAGHDVNYLAVSGALFGLGQDDDRPHFPSNLLGDFGAGSTYLVMGVLAALFERSRSGLGQTVDAAIVDGAAHLGTMAYGLLAQGDLVERRHANLLDGGYPGYELYETADNRHLAVGSLEPQFYEELVAQLGLIGAVPARDDPDQVDTLRELIAGAVRMRTAAEWESVFDGSDACVAAVLTMSEAAQHPHMVERGSFTTRSGFVEPAPAPRFSRTPATLGTPPPPYPGSDTVTALEAWGVANISSLLQSGAAFTGVPSSAEESWARRVTRAVHRRQTAAP